jgi:hypothetical protein
MKRTLAFLALLAACALGLHALEAKEGLVKLVVNDSTGRISVYKLVDVAKGRYEALMFDSDPRTSYPTLSADGRLYKLGDASEFRIKVSRSDTGVRIEYRSSSFVVTQSLDFAKSSGSALADGLLVAFSLENLSERETALGLRYLVDTWLGEKSGAHFATDKRPRVAAETAILPSDEDSWLSSPGDKASFMIQFAGAGIVRPDRIVLSNWKRLSDAPWSFDVNPQRNFTLVPYSINDSAVGLYWEPSAVSRGGSRKLSFVMGSFNDKGYAAATSARTQTEAIFESTVLGQAAPDAATSMAADLVAVRDLIGSIDRAVADGSVSTDELAAWRKILDRLEERKKGY